MKQGDATWIPGHGVRCNQCFMYFEDDNDVPLLTKDGELAEGPLDGYGDFHGCPHCKTDAYLIDHPDYAGGVWAIGKDPSIKRWTHGTE